MFAPGRRAGSSAMLERAGRSRGITWRRDGIFGNSTGPCDRLRRAPGGDGGDWAEASVETLDPRTPYLWTSPFSASRRLHVFFYHQRLSRGVVSGETVKSAEAFAHGVKARMIPTGLSN